MYMNSHYKDKTILGLSYICNGNPYTVIAASLYWNKPYVLLEYIYWYQIFKWEAVTWKMIGYQFSSSGNDHQDDILLVNSRGPFS